MNTKRLVVFLMIIIICVVVLAGCGGNNTELGEVGDGNEIVAAIGKTEITVDEYRYFILQNAAEEAQKLNPAFNGDFSGIDWSQKTESGETIAEVVKNRALGDIADYVAMVKFGEEKGVKIADEELSGVMSSMDEYKKEYGENGLKLALRAMGVSSEEGYKKLVTLLEGYKKVEKDFNQNREKYIDDEAALKEYRSEEEVSTQHILIMNDSEKRDNPEATIKEVLQRAKSGEDFITLMAEYNEDPGQPPAGYSFGKGVMVPEFETASFALDYNQISDVIESDYGYHIIKRIVGFCELKASLRGDIMINAEVYDALSVEEIIADVSKASEKMNKQQKGGK